MTMAIKNPALIKHELINFREMKMLKRELVNVKAPSVEMTSAVIVGVFIG